MTGETDVPNYLWDEGWVNRLNHSELILLFIFIRLFQEGPRDEGWTYLPEAELIKKSGLARATLYRAKRTLIEVTKLIDTQGDRGKMVGYRLRRDV